MQQKTPQSDVLHGLWGVSFSTYIMLLVYHHITAPPLRRPACLGLNIGLQDSDFVNISYI